MNTVSVMTELGARILDRPLRMTPFLSSKEFFFFFPTVTALADGRAHTGHSIADWMLS